MSSSKQILLLRHAKSSRSDPFALDFERPLNERGEEACVAIRQMLLERKISPDFIICSSAKRTRQTYEGLGDAVSHVPIVYTDVIYEATAAKLLNALKGIHNHYNNVMLIGHNPGMEDLCKVLTEGKGDPDAQARLSEKYPTGTLALLNTTIAKWEDLNPGFCHLQDFIRPADIKET